MSDGKVALSEVISKLRDELYEAGEQGKDHPLRLIVEEAEVELQVAVTKAAEGNVGVQFWVYSAGTKGSIAGATTQRVKLTLKPTVVVEGQRKKAEIVARD